MGVIVVGGGDILRIHDAPFRLRGRETNTIEATHVQTQTHKKHAQTQTTQSKKKQTESYIPRLQTLSPTESTSVPSTREQGPVGLVNHDDARVRWGKRSCAGVGIV